MRTLRRPKTRALWAGAQTVIAVAAVTGVTAAVIPHAQASRLVVSSAISNSGLRFNSQTGAFIDAMVPAGSGGLTYPEGMAVGPDGNLYIRSAGNVLQYDGITGNFIKVFATAGGGADPNNQSFQIRFDQSQGGLVVTPASGGLDGPTGLTFGPDGNLYVSSYGIVLRYSGQTGVSLGTFASGGGLVNATGLAFGPDNNLYVSCYPGNKILRYNGVTGAFLDTFIPSGLGGLDRPIGLAFGPDNHLYVCSYNNNRVLRYQGQSGQFQAIAAQGNGLSGPTGLSFGPDDNLYVASYLSDAVLRYNGSTGAFINAFVPTGSNGLDGPFAPLFLLQKPTDLTTAVQGLTQINLAWTDNSEDETGFEIERRTGTDPAAPFTTIAVIGANSTSYADTSLVPNTTYTYRVRGVVGTSESGYSNASTRSTPANPPTAPTVLTVNLAGPKALRLDWQDNSSNEAAFFIFRKVGENDFREIGMVLANTTSFVDTDLAPDVTWTYQVRAGNSGGLSAFTNTASGVPLPLVPNAPSGLAANVMSASQINLTWTDNSSGENRETGFSLLRKSGGGVYVNIATLPPNTTSYNDTELNWNTGYTYILRAANESGASAWTSEVSGTTLDVPPSAPATLSAAAMSPTRVDLAWSDMSNNETGFVVERKSGAGVFQPLTSLPANTTGYSDTSASFNTAYTYRVRAANGIGPSGWSNEVNVTTPSGLPAAPANLGVSAVSPTQVNVTWADMSNNEKEFVILRKTGSGVYARVGTAPANSTSFADKSVVGSTSYTYIMRATNDAGVSPWTNEVSVTTPNGPPAAPANLAASAASATQINLTWQDKSNNEKEFVILRKMGSGVYARVGTAPPNATSFADTTASPSTTYTYIMRASNDVGVSAWTNEASATTPNGAPLAPANLKAVAGSATQINLTWQDKSNNEKEFVILRKMGSGVYARVGTAPPNATSFTDSSASPNTTYTYIMRASNDVGVSPWTNESSATTPNGPPVAPANLKAVASGLQVNITWQDKSNNEKEFVLLRKVGTGVYERRAVLGPNVTSYIDTAVGPGNTYTYIMRATNEMGGSAWTNETSVTISP